MSEPLHASRTAVLVCQGRAAANGVNASGRFSDHTAMLMLRPEERVVVQRVRDGVVPRRWRERVDYEAVRASAEVIVPRTVAIDEAVCARASRAGDSRRRLGRPRLADVGTCRRPSL